MDYHLVADPSDRMFLRRALDARLSEFGHREHLRVAFVAVKANGGSVARAAALCKTVIRKMAARAGEPDKYHETITVAWATLMASHIAQSSATTWSELRTAEPRLADKNLLLRYYTRERLFSDEARAAWVAPDLAPLPSPPESAAAISR